jgi:hypothetical protein
VIDEQTSKLGVNNYNLIITLKSMNINDFISEKNQDSIIIVNSH